MADHEPATNRFVPTGDELEVTPPPPGYGQSEQEQEQERELLDELSAVRREWAGKHGIEAEIGFYEAAKPLLDRIAELRQASQDDNGR